MSLRLHTFLRRVQKIHGKKFSTAVEAKTEQISQVCSFRTAENNPANHNKDHIARLYTISEDDKQCLYQRSLPGSYLKQLCTFQENTIMVREPAVEIITYLNQTDYTRPINKYLLYGKFGTGKSITLGHIMHYAFVQKFILVNIPAANFWFKQPKEVANSVLSPGCVDLPIDAGLWLKHFKSQNAKLLPQLDLKTSKDYVWNQRETTSQGTSIVELVEFGLNRMKYACGVVDALIKELKMASTAGKCKTMVVIDGFNAFTSSQTRVYDENKEMILPRKISLMLPFFEITKDDWCNGAVILSVDEKANKERRESHLPFYLLGEEGLEHLDPFVPISVNNYSPAEFDAMIEYYKDRKWIRNLTPSGQRELELTTNRNPILLMQQCAFL